MAKYQEIIPIANQVTEKYHLCNNCLGRLFSKKLHLSSNKLLGKKLRKDLNSNQKCYICKDLFDHLDDYLKLMNDASHGYSYSSFSVGALIKPSIIERDDHIRSKYRLKGIDSIKTDVTKELGRSFSKKSRKNIEHLDPEITFTLNLKEMTCQLRSKSITFSGRYVKTLRGLAQKQKPCGNCSGKGCRVCNFHGISEFNSIEGLVSKFFFEKIGGTIARFTWIGGEDESSLVLGFGRPFFVKIQNPLKREVKSTRVKLDSLEIKNLKAINKSPKKPIKFTSLIDVKVLTEFEIDDKNLKKLKELKKQPVVVYDRTGKRSEKKVSSTKYKKESNKMFILTIKAEGGLPVKRFVAGDDVHPNISQILDVKCMCQEFDFLDIEVQ